MSQDNGRAWGAAGVRSAERAGGGRGESGRGARGASGPSPDPELVERPKRRRFTAKYKLEILEQADACARPGEVGELGDGGGNPLTAGLGFVGGVLGQALAFGKTPFDLLRGSGGEEKVLKNAKD